MEELEVVSVVYTEPTHTQILFTLKDKEGFEFPYYFCPNVGDEAPTYKYLQQLLSKVPRHQKSPYNSKKYFNNLLLLKLYMDQY